MRHLVALALGFGSCLETSQVQSSPGPEIDFSLEASEPGRETVGNRVYVGSPNLLTVRLELPSTAKSSLRIGNASTFWVAGLRGDLSPTPPDGRASVSLAVGPGGLTYVPGLNPEDLVALIAPGNRVSGDFIFPDPSPLGLLPGSYDLTIRITLPPSGDDDADKALPAQQQALVNSRPIRLGVVTPDSPDDQAAVLARQHAVVSKLRDFDAALALTQQLAAVAPQFAITGASMRYETLQDRGTLQDLREALGILESTLLPVARQRLVDHPELLNFERPFSEESRLNGLRNQIRNREEPFPEHVRNRNAHLDTSTNLMFHNRLAEALEEARRAVEADPDHWMPLKLVGIIYARLKQFEKAVEFLKRAEDAVGKDPLLGSIPGGKTDVERILKNIEDLRDDDD